MCPKNNSYILVKNLSGEAPKMIGEKPKKIAKIWKYLKIKGISVRDDVL